MLKILYSLLYIQTFIIIYHSLILFYLFLLILLLIQHFYYLIILLLYFYYEFNLLLVQAFYDMDYYFLVSINQYLISHPMMPIHFYLNLQKNHILYFNLEILNLYLSFINLLYVYHHHLLLHLYSILNQM